MNDSESVVDQAAEGKPKVKGKKPVIAACVLAAVVAVAGAGFWVWHETPSFCGAICHTPMDPYLATYEEEPAKDAVDKYGNTVDGRTMIAALHRVRAQATCLDCHEPTLSQQIGEGVAWVTGSYEVVNNDAYGVVIKERSLSELTAAQGKGYEEFCMNEECHSTLDRESLAEATSDEEFNYHDQESADHGVIAECGDCHKAHTQSVVMCTQCHEHEDVEVPRGWLTFDEYKDAVLAA